MERRQSAADRRVNEAVVTAAGKAMTDRLDLARERIVRSVLSDWERHDIGELLRLMRKLADAMKEKPGLSKTDEGAIGDRKASG